MKRKRIRILELATVCAVLGIIVSLAIPSYLRMQKRSRIDRLLEYARYCREELPDWLVNDGDGKGEAEGKVFSTHSIPEEGARMESERLPGTNRSSEARLLVVKPTGTKPAAACKEDGRTHIIPWIDPANEDVRARVAVTGEVRTDGSDPEGIVAGYNSLPAEE